MNENIREFLRSIGITEEEIDGTDTLQMVQCVKLSGSNETKSSVVFDTATEEFMDLGGDDLTRVGLSTKRLHETDDEQMCWILEAINGESESQYFVPLKACHLYGQHEDLA